MKCASLVVVLLLASVPILSAQSGAARQPEAYRWGQPGDVPIAGDFDGDKVADLVIYRPSSGTWYLRLSSRQFSLFGTVTIQWGQAGDVPMPGDYDGDGITDVAVFRPSTGVWYLTFSGGVAAR